MLSKQSSAGLGNAGGRKGLVLDNLKFGLLIKTMQVWGLSQNRSPSVQILAQILSQWSGDWIINENPAN
jgi:hypothetical protein